MLVNGAQKYSSFRYDVHEPLGAVPNLGLMPVNFSGVVDPEGQPTQFTIGARIRVTGLEGASMPVVTMQGSHSVIGSGGADTAETFQIYVDATGQLRAGFPGSTQLQSFVGVNDGIWHHVGVSFQGTSDNQNTIIKLFLDGVLIDETQVSTASQTYYPYTYGYIGRDCTMPLDFGNLVIWEKAVPQDHMDIPDWFSPAGPLKTDGLAANFDFSHGRIGTMASAGMVFGNWQGNNGQSSSSSKLDWNITCANIPAGTSLKMPIRNPFMETMTGAPFTLMGWMGLPPSTGTATFLQSGSMKITMTYNAAKDQVAIEYDNKGGTMGQGRLDFFSASDLHFIAVTSDGTTLTIFVDGEEFATTLLADMPTTIQYETVFGGNATDQTMHLQNLVMFSKAMTPDAMAQAIVANDPFACDTCMAWLPLTENLIDTQSNSSLMAEGAAPTFGEMKLPVPAGWQPSAPVAAHMQKRAEAMSEPVSAMRYKDFIRLAEQQGINTSAPPSGKVKRDVKYQTSVAYYTKALGASDLHPTLQTRLLATFERNLAIGLQLADTVPEAGRLHIREEGETSILTYHDGKQHHELLDLSTIAHHDLRSDVTGAQIAKLFTDVVMLILAALGAIVAASGVSQTFARVVRRLLPVMAELQPILAAVPAEGATITQAMVNVQLKILQIVHGIGLLGQAVWHGIVAHWWSFALTVASIVFQIIGYFISGGWLLLVKLAQMAISIHAIVVDIMEMVNPPPPQPQN